MFALFTAQFALPPFFGHVARLWITYVFFAWAVVALIGVVLSRRAPAALASFLETWRAHVAVGPAQLR